MSIEIDLIWMAIKPLPKFSLCSICPVSSAPFTQRFQGRLMLLEAGTGGRPERRVFLWPYLILLISTVLACELVYWIIPTPLQFMKKITSLLFVLLVITTPAYILLNRPNDYNVTAQVLFSVLLFGASLWFAHEQNTEKAKKEASSKWLPAAEGACKQLVTITHIVTRMRANQKASCSKLDPLIPSNNTEGCRSIKYFFDMQCKDAAENFSTIKNQLDNAISHWEMFIAENCESDSCYEINQRIENHKSKLEIDSAGALDSQSCNEG